MGVALADGSLVGPRRHLSAVLAPETAPKGAAAPGLVPGPEVEMELASVPAPQPVLAPAPFAVLPPSISSPANPPPLLRTGCMSRVRGSHRGGLSSS